MPQGSFAAQVTAWIKETKARERAVYRGSAQRVIEVMQTPGPSKATVKAAVAAGAGLGKPLKRGGRGKGKRAFGPIVNPGGPGNLPVDTGFLRASLVGAIGTVSVQTRAPAENQGPVSFDPGPINLLIAGADITDPIEVRYTAVYARVAEYGGTNRRPARFVGLAAQQWPQIVQEECAKAQGRASG